MKIESHKVVMCDVDDTLVLWDKSEYSHIPSITVKYAGKTSEVIVNQKNVNLLIKLVKLGYTVIVWSATGYDWAETIVKAIGIEKEVTMCMSKPRYYIDDKDSKLWIGERLYRDPITGGSNGD